MLNGDCGRYRRAAGVKGRIRMHILMGSVFAVLMIPAFALMDGQMVATEKVAYTVEGARPLAQALVILEKEFRFYASYEDVVPMRGDDVVDQAVLPGKNAWIFRGGKFVFEVERLKGRPVLADPRRTVEELVDQYNRSGLTGNFRVVWTGPFATVVPVAAKDSRGVLQPVVSPMSVKVTIPRQTDAGHKLLQTLCDAVTAESHMKVLVGLYWGNLPGRAGTLEASGEEARVVLVRMLESLNEHARGGHDYWIWHLYFNTSGEPYYVLNLPVAVSLAPKDIQKGLEGNGKPNLWFQP